MNGKFSFRQIVGFFIANRYAYSTMEAERIYNRSGNGNTIKNMSKLCIQAIEKRAVRSAGDDILQPILAVIDEQYTKDDREYIKNIHHCIELFRSNKMLDYLQLAMLLGYLNRLRYHVTLRDSRQDIDNITDIDHVDGLVDYGSSFINKNTGKVAFVYLIKLEDGTVVRVFRNDLLLYNMVKMKVKLSVQNCRVVTVSGHKCIEGDVTIHPPRILKDTSYLPYYSI